MRASMSTQASPGAKLRAAYLPNPTLTVAVTTPAPHSSCTSWHVARSPETKTAGTPKLPATAATMPDSPTGLPLIVALYQLSLETVWQRTPSDTPAMAWAPTKTTQSHSPRSIGSTYRAQGYPTT